MKALAREPEHRWAWASELRDALVPWTRAGSPAGEPAMARLMATLFPGELRAEVDRLERLRRLPRGPDGAAALPREPVREVRGPPAGVPAVEPE